MRATWRPLATWPHPPRRKQSGTFPSSWDSTLDLLDTEITKLAGDDVVIGIVLDPVWISLSGGLKSGALNAVKEPGAEVSFSLPDGRRLVFFTDAYKTLRYNLRAIAVGLEALRAVDRYGITSTSEQYAGFAQLTDGGPDMELGRRLVEAAGGVNEALKRHHPDKGGNAREFAAVQAYRKQIGAGA